MVGSKTKTKVKNEQQSETLGTCVDRYLTDFDGQVESLMVIPDGKAFLIRVVMTDGEVYEVEARKA